MTPIRVIDGVAVKQCQLAADFLQTVDDTQFDIYDNPFESKQVLKTKYPGNWGDLGSLITFLEAQIVLAEVSFHYRLVPDATREYASVFRYGPQSRLDVHVDAGISPTSGLRKAVTAILYLNDVSSGGHLEFWRGTGCDGQRPEVYAQKQIVAPRAGLLVLFENHDSAWHGMSECGEFRAAITVSFMSRDLTAFRNQRQKAYFIPRPGEEWSEDKLALRDARASADTAKAVYRIGPSSPTTVMI